MTSIADETQWLDATDQAQLVRDGSVTPLELLNATLERADKLNPVINALTYRGTTMPAGSQPHSPTTKRCRSVACHLF